MRVGKLHVPENPVPETQKRAKAPSKLPAKKKKATKKGDKKVHDAST